MTPRITFTARPDAQPNTCQLDLQVTDPAGQALPGVHLLDLYWSDSPQGAELAKKPPGPIKVRDPDKRGALAGVILDFSGGSYTVLTGPDGRLSLLVYDELRACSFRPCAIYVGTPSIGEPVTGELGTGRHFGSNTR